MHAESALELHVELVSLKSSLLRRMRLFFPVGKYNANKQVKLLPVNFFKVILYFFLLSFKLVSQRYINFEKVHKI